MWRLSGATSATTGPDHEPRVGLECRYDDPFDPSELTVYAPGERRRVTEWITVEHTAAVRLDRVR